MPIAQHGPVSVIRRGRQRPHPCSTPCAMLLAQLLPFGSTASVRSMRTWLLGHQVSRCMAEPSTEVSALVSSVTG